MTEKAQTNMALSKINTEHHFIHLNAIWAAAELAGRASAALRVGAAGGSAAVGTAPELGVLATAALL